ncbi:MAG: hypothetical protein AAF740_08340 [Bacteroidota bacterium]
MNVRKETQISDFLRQQDFIVRPNQKFEEYDLSIDLYAEKRGRVGGLIPSRDFYFIHFLDQKLKAEKLKTYHEIARQIANSYYKLPKILRLSAPGIFSVFITHDPVTEEVQKVVTRNTRAFSGGEVHAMFLLDLNEKQLYCQGENRVKGKAYQKSDPQNRALQTVLQLSGLLFD